MGKKRKMTKGKPFLHIIFSAVSLLFSGYVAADTGVDDHVHRGDSLHKAYDFAGAEQAYLHALDSLDVVEDSLLVQDIREKLRMTENGKNMSRFVQSPQPAGKMRFSLDEFFLAYPLEDRSWRPVPNVLDTSSAHPFARALYAPDWNDVLYYSAESSSGSRDIMTVSLEDTLWTVPSVLPALSDASADEIYPMLSPDGKTLFFSSKGLYGVGGYDLYKSVWDEGAGRWSDPQNMGFPYSSPADDFLYVESEDGAYALFASNRECSKDSVYVYAVRYEDFPLHSPVEDPQKLHELSLLDPPVRRTEEVVVDIPDNELTLRYMDKMRQVKSLRDSISVISSALGHLRNEYVFGNDAGERLRLTQEILALETRVPVLQKELDDASAQLGAIELEFLKEGIFLNMDMQKDDEEDPVPEMPGYDFRMRSPGDSLDICLLEPEVVFDYTFRTGEVAEFAEDQTIPDGIVYQVQLFSGGRKASVAELKGLSPVYEHRTPGGMYTYRAGLFRTYSEASQAVDVIRRKGFRDAYIAAFIDRNEVSVVTARTEEAARTDQVLLYQVRIVPDSGELDSEVIEGMMRMAMGKDIARIEAEDGTQIFIVGPFDNKTLAEEVAGFVRNGISGTVVCELHGN